MIEGFNTTSVAIMLIVVLLTGFVGVQVVDAATSEKTQDYYEQSEQWCSDHNGELYNAQAIAHGGLHCELENGTTVHMSDVMEGISA